jgi:hypothetical protein
MPKAENIKAIEHAATHPVVFATTMRKLNAPRRSVVLAIDPYP